MNPYDGKLVSDVYPFGADNPGLFKTLNAAQTEIYEIERASAGTKSSTLALVHDCGKRNVMIVEGK